MTTDTRHSAGSSSDPDPGDRSLRLQLASKRPAGVAVNGGWWPRSTDLAAELPGLLAAVRAELGPVGLIGYHLNGWDRTGDQLDVDGESVRLQGFTSGTPLTVLLIGTSGSRLTLLVVPPQTPEASARQALRDAAQPVDETAEPMADEDREAADEEHRGLAARLVAVRGSIDMPTIERWVLQAARQFHDAPIQAYVPVLIEHIVRQQIRASTT